MRSATRRPAAIVLILLMAIGSITLWIGIPLGWIWIASQFTTTTQPRISAYLLIIVAIPVSMAIVARGLRVLNRKYGELTGQVTSVRYRGAWLRSMRGERQSNRPMTVLDIVMVASVSLALLVLLVWFLFLAGSPLPNV